MKSRFDRREFVAMAGALLGSHVLSVRSAPSPATVTSADAIAEQLLSDTAEAILVQHPESATALGIDEGARASLKRRLTDRTAEGIGRARANTHLRLARLQGIDASQLSEASRLSLGVAKTAHELALEGYAFGFGDVVTLSSEWSYRNSPYVVAQNTGAFIEIPDFVDSKHTIKSPADADSYLQRLREYARSLDGETQRLARDRSKGVVAPAFLLDKTMGQIRAARSRPIGEWTIVTSLAKRTHGMPGSFATEALRISTREVAPALDRQMAELSRHRAVANDDAGVWKLKDGEGYYGWALRAATTSNLAPAEVHRIGLEQFNELTARMEPLLRGLGMTQGSVGARMTALGKDPRYLYPNTDAGRAQLLGYVNERLDDIRTRLPNAFATLVPGRLIVKRVPPEIELGAAGGYAGPGSIDGTVPGSYYINLRDMAGLPRFGLPTLSYHEGIPGHVWQGEYSYKLPLIRSLLAFNAYSEGWALYSEQLADELGVYEGDPVGRLGYLQSLAFRACRLVVDSGIHAKRWSRAQAIEWFATSNGSPVAEVTSEVDRYCAWPGQACGYKVGHNEINRLRNKSIGALGARYDLRRFDDAVVLAGNVPLTLLEQVIDSFITQTSKGAA